MYSSKPTETQEYALLSKSDVLGQKYCSPRTTEEAKIYRDTSYATLSFGVGGHVAIALYPTWRSFSTAASMERVHPQTELLQYLH